MKHTLAALVATTSLLFGLGALPAQAQDLEQIKVGFCAKTLNITAAQFAIAESLGYFAEGGIEVEVVPLGGSTECVQNLAAGTLDFTYATADAVLVGKARGVDAVIYYTILHKNIFGIAVEENSPIQSIADLKGKNIGVTSMGSTGVLVARALAAMNDLNPDTDLNLVTIGEAGQSAALLRSGEVDALSQFSTNYALIESTGTKLRRLDSSAIDSFPSATLIGLRGTMAEHGAAATALARGYAMASLFAIENPEAATQIVREFWPQTQGSGQTEEQAAALDKVILESYNFALDVRDFDIDWGMSNVDNYVAYVDFLKQWGVIEASADVDPSTFVDNSLIEAINDFDADAIIAQAASY